LDLSDDEVFYPTLAFGFAGVKGEVLELSEVERRRLHVAACMDQGFEVGPL